MADVNANIGVNIDTSNALSQLKSLQKQIAQFHLSVAKSSEAAALAQRDLQKNLINNINAIGSFSAELRTVKTSAESFTNSLEKNKFSMREYFRFAGGSTKTFGRLFKSEFDTIGKVAEERVKRLQTQYIKLGRDTTGAMKAIAVMPTELNLRDHSTQLQIAAQRQAIFNQLVRQGSTNLLNFGKNTQWAGRQLMVGFTIPLTLLGTAAAKTFMEMEEAAIKFRKVYGDLFTPEEERKQALADIQALGESFTKYGIAVSETIGLSAEAAAAGFQGLDLQRQTTQATRLQILGQIDAQKALETTISLQNAFQTSSESLAESIDFLNAVENQTVLSLDDVTTAIPKAAPVVKQLGGDVKDLAFFMAAMKEGGISASQGANALKSGLASLINPTDKARDMMKGFGIDIDSIVNKNAGNVKQTVIEFAEALDNLSDLNRQRAIEQLFGKFQLARLSTLFENVIRDGTQASRVLDLASASTAELAGMAEQELGMVAESSMNKFRKAVEDLKLALVPVGQTFLEAITPLVEGLGRILEKFASLSDGSKKAITIITVAIGGIAPVLLMTFGLLANFVANTIKFFAILRNGYLKLTGQSKILGAQTDYLTMEQIEAAAAAHSLNQSHANLTQTFGAEANAVRQLIAAYKSATTAARSFAAANPGMMAPIPGKRGGTKKYASGVVSVPGPKGAGDVVPAMLSPGEAVIPADMVRRYGPLIQGMVSGNIPGFQEGLVPGYTNAVVLLSEKINQDLRDRNKKKSASVSALMSEFSKGKAGIQAPIIDAVAKEMGAVKPNDVIKLIKNDPNLAKFGDNISAGVTKELGKILKDNPKATIKDTELSKIFDKVARREAKKFGKVYESATGKFLTQPTTFEDVTQTRVSSSGDKKSMGRAQIFKNVKSYKNIKYGPIAAALGLSTVAGLVRAHVGPKTMVDLAELSQQGQLTTTAIKAYERKTGQKVSEEIKNEVKKQENKAKKATAKSKSTTKKTGAAKPATAPRPTFGQRAAGLGRSLAGGRAGMAATTGLMAASFLPGRTGQVAGQAMGAAFGLQALSMIFKLPIPHIKAFTVGIAATVGIIKLVNAARERERRSIEGLADAATLTEEKVKNLGEFFGIVPTKAPFESDIQQAVLLPEQRSQVSALRESGTFKKDFGTDIEVLRGASAQEAARVFQTIATGLQGKGFAKEQIQTIITALREESGKTAVIFDFESVNIQTKGGRAGIIKSAEGLATSYAEAFATGFESKMVQEGGIGPGGRGGVQWVKKLVPTKELEKETKLAAREVSNMFLGLSGALSNGLITGNQFNTMVDKLEQNFLELEQSNPSAALMLTSKMMELLPKSVRKAAEGVETLAGRLLITRMQMVGMTNEIPRLAGALRLLEMDRSNRAETEHAARAEIYVENTKKRVRQASKDLAKEFKKLMDEMNDAAGGDGAGEKKFSLIEFLTEGIKKAKDQTDALKALKKAGVEAALAAELASNPEAADAIARLAKNSKEGWEEALKLIKNYQKALKNLEDQQFAMKSPAEQMGEALRKLSSYYDLQEELIRLNFAAELEKQNRNLQEQETVLDGIDREIEKINRNIEEKTAPLTKLLQDNNYELERISFIEDEINEKYDKQEETLDKIATLQQNIAEIQRGRLSVADALTRGDISAAASAIQELRATQSSQAITSQRDVLAAARKQELSALKRVEIEKQNKLINFEIATIQRQANKESLDALQDKKKAIESNIFTIEGQIAGIEANIQSKISAMATRFQAMFGTTKSQIDGIVKALDLSESAGIAGNKKTLDMILAAASGSATGLNTALSKAPTLFDPVLTKFKEIYDVIKSIYDISGTSSGVITTPSGTTLSDDAATRHYTAILEDQNKKTNEAVKEGAAKIAESEAVAAISGGDFTPATVVSAPATTTTTSTSTPSPSTVLTDLAWLWEEIMGFAGGGMVKPKYFANGSFARGTDTIPAMLTPGEFVVRKSAVDNIGVSALNKINDGSYDGSGVYNYNLNVTLNGSNMDPNDVANAVMTRIKQIDGQRIRRQVI